jgi:hypothetical protein|nr:MAG TPA: hypothetical protein [Caudoviricetes sp.]
MKMSRETKLGLIYIKRKILSHAYDIPISYISKRSVVDVEDIENVFEDIINGSETSVQDKFEYDMKKDLEDLFSSFTPEEVAAMNRK